MPGESDLEAGDGLIEAALMADRSTFEGFSKSRAGCPGYQCAPGVDPVLVARNPDLLTNYRRSPSIPAVIVGAVGFEPTKAEPSDLQSDPFVHFGMRPGTTTPYRVGAGNIFGEGPCLQVGESSFSRRH